MMIKKLIAAVIFTVAVLPSLNGQSSLDKVIAVIGNEAILESDIDMLYRDLQMRGQLKYLGDGNPRCQILKIFRDQKLLVAQAKLDSLGSEENIQHNVDRHIATIIAQHGKETLEAHYKKSIEQFREESIEFQTEESYANAMKAELAGKIKVTPGEVAKFFKTLSSDTVPIIIPDQYVIYEIAKKPNSEKAILDVKEKLLGLRKRILDGDKFQTLATLYSEDEESAIRGGEMGLQPIAGYVASIRTTLGNMRAGQVSKIIESEDGYHILQLLEKQDETGLVNFRQILIKPKYSREDQAAGFARLDSIVKKIKSDSITFEQAALAYSENEKSRAGNGLLINTTNEYAGEIRSTFYPDELNAADFKAVQHLGVGEISDPFVSIELRSRQVLYKVIMLKEFIPSHPINLKDDFNRISSMYKNKKQSDAVEAWITKKAETEYIRISEKYKECPFVNAEWLF
jgi:peptidyl-prolyl cis-trans isomerase SurA